MQCVLGQFKVQKLQKSFNSGRRVLIIIRVSCNVYGCDAIDTPLMVKCMPVNAECQKININNHINEIIVSSLLLSIILLS